MTILTNPIIPGFHPDPSAIQVGEDYYIANSTFEWWPGVDIYHSRDLVNWEWICSPLTRTSQVDLMGDPNAGAIWAPHLSYAKGLYWLVFTDVKSATIFKDTLNYLVTAPSITGPWSDPVFVTASGFDPSLFHDDDGRSWFINMLYDWRMDHDRFAGVVLQEFDTNTRQLIGPRHHIFHGTSLGVCEGPQIYRRGAYYYLVCAAGGTEWNHAATVVRSRRLTGPWEESPYTPLITSRDDPDGPLQKAGHCSLLRYRDQWYITYLCSRPLGRRGDCVLGRETALEPISWDLNGWPHLASGGHNPSVRVNVSGSQADQRSDYSESVRFEPGHELPPSFKTLRGPLRPGLDYSLEERPGWLRLHGGQSLSSLHRQTLIARRWQSFNFDAHTRMEFEPTNFQQTAGLILFYDTSNWIYAFVSASQEEPGSPVARILVNEGDSFHYGCDPVPIQPGLPIDLEVRVRGVQARFYLGQEVSNLPDGGRGVCPESSELLPLGGIMPANHLSDDHVGALRGKTVFSGAMVGVCAQDLDEHRSWADFEGFDYREVV